MKVDKNQGYMPKAQRELEDSPVYAFKQWRNTEDSREDVLENFFTFLARDIECEDVKEEKAVRAALKIFRQALPLFLNVDMDKVKQGELELLSRWTENNK